MVLPEPVAPTTIAMTARPHAIGTRTSSALSGEPDDDALVRQPLRAGSLPPAAPLAIRRQRTDAVSRAVCEIATGAEINEVPPQAAPTVERAAAS